MSSLGTQPFGGVKNLPERVEIIVMFWSRVRLLYVGQSDNELWEMKRGEVGASRVVCTG